MFLFCFRLMEPKKILIERVVRAIGKKKAIELLVETATIEQDGGLYTMVSVPQRCTHFHFCSPVSPLCLQIFDQQQSFLAVSKRSRSPVLLPDQLGRYWPALVHFPTGWQQETDARRRLPEPSETHTQHLQWTDQGTWPAGGRFSAGFLGFRRFWHFSEVSDIYFVGSSAVGWNATPPTSLCGGISISLCSHKLLMGICDFSVFV